MYAKPATVQLGEGVFGWAIFGVDEANERSDSLVQARAVVLYTCVCVCDLYVGRCFVVR